MASTTFTSGTTIASSWLNDVNTTTYTTVPGIVAGTVAVPIPNDSISAAKIQSDAVTTVKIINDAVTTAKILDANVTAAKLATGAAVSNIGTGGITATQLASNAVTTVKITDANVTPAKLSQPLTLGTVQSTLSGTAVDFTNIPSWVKRVTVMFQGVSTNGTNPYRVQLGTGGTPTTSGYVGSTSWLGSGGSSAVSALSSGFDINSNSSAPSAITGHLIFTNISGNIWIASGTTGFSSGTSSVQHVGGAVNVGGVLNMVRITSLGGTDSFDAGTVNILYE
jgi:hypothetical protein